MLDNDSVPAPNPPLPTQQPGYLDAALDAKREAWRAAVDGAGRHNAEVDPGVLPPADEYPGGLPPRIPTGSGTAYISEETRAAYRELQRAAKEATAVRAYDLVERYAHVIHAPVPESTYSFQPDNDAAPPVGWEIEKVRAKRCNIQVILGDDKSTKSTEADELAVTFTTGSPHWGLLPFQEEVGVTAILQEEVDKGILVRTLEEIRQARGLSKDAGDHLLLRYSKQGFNLMNDQTRAWLCYLVEGSAVEQRPPVKYLILDSLDLMGVPKTDLGGSMRDGLAFLTRLSATYDVNVIVTWPMTSGTRFALESAYGGDEMLRWWVGGMALAWNPKTLVRSVKVDAQRNQFGRYTYKLQGAGPLAEDGHRVSGHWKFIGRGPLPEAEAEADEREAREQARPASVAEEPAAPVDPTTDEKAQALYDQNPSITAVELQDTLGISRSYSFQLLRDLRGK